MRKLEFFFIFLLALFVLNFAVLDSLTTQIALSGGNCYESNFILANLNIDLVTIKLLGSLFIVSAAVWVYRKDKQLAVTTMQLFTAFSCGIVLNNVLNILGGLS